MKQSAVAKFLKQQVTMIYMAKDGSLTKRRIKIDRITETSVTGYCYLRKQQRTFRLNQILAMQPQTTSWRISS
jgi:predicted DNA-binding transcriptional regulator YafY